MQFLDFSQIPNYHPDGFFKSIGPQTPNTPLEPGIKMHNVLELMEATATLVVRPHNLLSLTELCVQV